MQCELEVDSCSALLRLIDGSDPPSPVFRLDDQVTRLHNTNVRHTGRGVLLLHGTDVRRLLRKIRTRIDLNERLDRVVVPTHEASVVAELAPRLVALVQNRVPTSTTLAEGPHRKKPTTTTSELPEQEVHVSTKLLRDEVRVGLVVDRVGVPRVTRDLVRDT